MREQKYHVYLTADEQSRVIQSLIRLKNELIEQGRYTDAVDDVLCKVVSAKKKSIYGYEPRSTVSKAYTAFTKEVLADGRKKERLHTHEAR